MRIQETWEQFIGGIRSVATRSSIDDPAYLEFEKASFIYSKDRLEIG
jgi:hypothetical protein